jgi:hypothetical protein
MAFQPRTHENGGPCCTAELALCDKCKAHFAWGGAPRAASLRTAVDFTPPDPYRDGLERLHRELPSTRWPEPPTPRPTNNPGDFTPPDPYQPALDKMRKEQR